MSDVPCAVPDCGGTVRVRTYPSAPGRPRSTVLVRSACDNPECAATDLLPDSVSGA